MTDTARQGGHPSRPAAGDLSRRTDGQPARTRRLRMAAGAAGAAVAVVAALAVALFAAHRAAPATSSLRQSAASAQPVGGPARVGSPFPDFRLTSADGAEVTAATLRGSNAIVWFTTSYCVPCQEGALRYQKAARQLGSKAPTILMVFLDPREPNAALLDWRRKFGQPTWVPALDTGGLGQRAGVQILDTKIFLDTAGVVRDINTAPVDDAYSATVKRLATGA